MATQSERRIVRLGTDLSLEVDRFAAANKNLTLGEIIQAIDNVRSPLVKMLRKDSRLRLVHFDPLEAGAGSKKNEVSNA